MKVFLDSIGCRLNQSEIETMARQLIANGHEIVGEADSAERIILNTCAVTNQATKDTRQKVRRFNRNNADAEIIVTGCHATIAPDDIAVLPGVSAVVLNEDKETLVRKIDPKAILDLPVYDREPIVRDFVSAGLGNTRAFIKVQDGCQNKCTFCVTTIARGESRSRHMGDIIREIRSLVSAGYQEAVLTGVHLGSYGHDFGNKAGLYDLTQLILRETDLPRLRLSSLEPWEIADGFFELWQNPRLLPHLHMPLQSGCDTTLRRMARKTSQASFRKLAEDAHKNIPDLNLTTDIIVGFPGETAGEFESSYEYVREIGFSRLHVFGYSPRPGTAAATMPDHVSADIRKERVQRMIALGKTNASAFHQSYVGSTTNVLWEMPTGADENGMLWSGYTDNYIRVTGTAPNSADYINRITPTHLTQATCDRLHGKILA